MVKVLWKWQNARPPLISSEIMIPVKTLCLFFESLYISLLFANVILYA